jgi:phosphate:Na+ symporter
MVPLIYRLAENLCRWIPEKSTDVAEARYLSDAAIEFPETVLSSVKKEVWHLFDSAFEIIAHGMNLHRKEILESPDLEKTIDNDREVHELDLDEIYENKVKILYSAIIDFISRSQSKMPSVFSEELFRLRNAATDIVKCVKHIKHLRKNATKYMISDNEHIRKEYNRLRYQIAIILREIYRLREDDETDYALAALELDELKAEVQVTHGELNDRIADVLTDNQITPLMATSLLNDFNYADDTSNLLLDCAQALFASHADLMAEATQEIFLDEEEIEEISAS